MLYARFWTRALAHIGLIDVKEPFASLFTQGMVTHETYSAIGTFFSKNQQFAVNADVPYEQRPRWLSPSEVERRDGKVVTKLDGFEVTVGRVEKMSKSKKNVVDPDLIIETYGADAIRWFVLSDSPPERDLPWSEAGIEGCSRFVQRVWRQVAMHSPPLSANADFTFVPNAASKALERIRHKTISGVAADIESLQYNKAVAKLYSFVGAVEKSALVHDDDIKALILAIAPMMPHLAEEAWAAIGGEGLVADAAWPPVDLTMLVEDEVTIAIQVMGKLRDTITVPKGQSETANVELAFASSKVLLHTGTEEPRKVIYVPDRLINIIPGRVMKPT